MESDDTGYKEAIRTLIERVRQHRLERQWSQAEMAARVGLDRRTYQRLENGELNITLRNLARVIGVLGFSDRLANVIPAPSPTKTLDELIEANSQPPPVRVRRRRSQ